MYLSISLIFVALLTAIYVIVFNRLQDAITRVEQGWSGVEVQLKRRHQLVPGLVAAVKSAMKHEEEFVAKLIDARKKAEAALDVGDKELISKTEITLRSQMRSLLVRIEDNPEITATQNIVTFQKQLEETEDQIAASRRIYNGNVQSLNARIASFPGNLVAQRHGIKAANSFELAQDETSEVYRGPSVQL
jgi:LemA protein